MDGYYLCTNVHSISIIINMFLYNTGILLYTCAIYITSLFKPKAKLWVNGRKQWREKLKSQFSKLPQQKRIWIHCASLGEFEQGRPIIEAIKIFSGESFSKTAVAKGVVKPKENNNPQIKTPK